MVFTNTGREMVTMRLGSSLPNMYIGYMGIGSGSGTASVTDSTLLNEVNRTAFTGSPNFTTTQKVSFQADFNTAQMSGIHLTEFGLTETTSGTGFAGSFWQRESFGSVVFDGTNELQISTTLNVI